MIFASNVSGVITQQVTLQINITEAIPPVLPNGIRWLFKGMELAPNERITFAFALNKVSLTINNLNVSDEGIYIITVSNPAGSSTGYIHVDVQSK